MNEKESIPHLRHFWPEMINQKGGSAEMLFVLFRRKKDQVRLLQVFFRFFCSFFVFSSKVFFLY